MEKVLVGKYVSTHGIKGEIRIKSNFKYKNKVFIVGNKIYINNQEYIINSYRIHKEYDMITLKGFDNINQVLPFKGSNVYINKDDLKLNNNEYLDSDLIGMSNYINNDYKGKVTDINYLNKNKKLLVINSRLVPFELIKEIDFNNSRIIIEEVDGLL